MNAFTERVLAMLDHYITELGDLFQKPSEYELRTWYDVSDLTPAQRERFYVALVEIALRSNPRKL
ncbi:hypothetical protein H8U31_001277 [Salmonella enterica]|nr:hypothetical protein [Salmonella enterica]